MEGGRRKLLNANAVISTNSLDTLMWIAAKPARCSVSLSRFGLNPALCAQKSLPDSSISLPYP